MTTVATSIELPPDFQRQAEEWVRAGRFRSVQEAVLAALGLLQENEAKRSRLAADIDDALEAHARGELPELEDGEFADWLDRQ